MCRRYFFRGLDDWNNGEPTVSSWDDDGFGFGPGKGAASYNQVVSSSLL